MPFKRQYKNQCHTKKGYSTLDRAMEFCRTTYKGRAADMNAYFCPWCRMWHLGHRKGKKPIET